MIRFLVPVALLFPCVPASSALAQDSRAAPPGQEVFEGRCAVCHGEAGEGRGSTFPALAGNEGLEDLGIVVKTIRGGRGAMPPFPDLTADELVSVVTYLRTAWGNSLGAVSAAEVAEASGTPATPAAGTGTIWDGIYSEEQAQRGQEVYGGPCGWCHGRRLDGAADDPDMRSAPPIARAKFLRRWEQQSLGSLYAFVRATMPENSPGAMTDQEYVDLIAYMLSVSGAPAGDRELPPDPEALATIRIEQRP